MGKINDMVKDVHETAVQHVMDRNILEVKEKARTDMARCDIPCRMTAPNMFMAQMEKKRKDPYFI